MTVEQKVFSESHDGNIASYVEAIIFQPTYGKDPVCYIHAVFTYPRFRKAGRASKLVVKAIDYAKQRGCYKAFLVCKPELEKWYKKNGLEKTGVQMQVVF